MQTPSPNEQNRTATTRARAWKWDKAKQEAAFLVAEDRLTDEEIATDVGASRTTLHEWKTTPEFRQRVAEHAAAILESVKQIGIGSVEARIRAQDARWRGLRDVIRERAVDLAGEAPGGASGLLVRQTKFVKVFEPKRSAAERARDIESIPDDDFIATKQTKAVTEYAVDTGLLAELRALEMHTAKELGQWEEKSRVEHDLSKLSDAEIVQRAAAALGGGAAPGTESGHGAEVPVVRPASPDDETAGVP